MRWQNLESKSVPGHQPYSCTEQLGLIANLVSAKYLLSISCAQVSGQLLGMKRTLVFSGSFSDGGSTWDSSQRSFIQRALPDVFTQLVPSCPLGSNKYHLSPERSDLSRKHLSRSPAVSVLCRLLREELALAGVQGRRSCRVMGLRTGG